MKNNYFIIYSLILAILFGPSNSYAYSNTLFKTPEKVLLNYTKKVYDWDKNNYKNIIDVETINVSSSISSSSIGDQIMTELGQSCVTGNCPSKITYEFNYNTQYNAETDVNFVHLEQLDNKTGKNEYKNLINSSTLDDKSGKILANTKVDEIDNIKPRVLMLTMVSNLGQKARTYGIKSFEDRQAKKLFIEAFRVNYLDLYKEHVRDYCNKNKPIPRLITNANSLLALATPSLDAADRTTLLNNSGIININKANDICTKSETDIGTVIFNTGLFFKSGDIRLNNKDHNANIMLSSSLTADALYHYNGTDANIIYDKDWKTSVHKKSKKIGRKKYWLEMTTKTDWVKLVPLTTLSTANNFGSYNFNDVGKNGAKIAGIWPQAPLVESSLLTPEGHSINFTLIPMKKYDGTGINNEPLYNNSTWQKSSVKTVWATWLVILVTVLMTIAVGIIGILIWQNAIDLWKKDNKPSTGRALKLPERSPDAESNAMINKVDYADLLGSGSGTLGDINNTSNYYFKTTAPNDNYHDNFMDTGNKLDSMDYNSPFNAYSGSFIWSMMKDAPKFWNGGHIEKAFRGFVEAVNINNAQRVNNASLTKNNSGQGSMAPTANYRFMVDSITSIIDFSFKNSSGGLITAKEYIPNTTTINTNVNAGNQNNTSITTTTKTRNINEF